MNEHLLFSLTIVRPLTALATSRCLTYLMTLGFPRHIVALIQALYEKQSAIVRWNGSHTKPFFIEKGVWQGCILSPLLFCAYTEQVMREAEITELGAVIGGRIVDLPDIWSAAVTPYLDS